jgi:hypothetical protein
LLSRLDHLGRLEAVQARHLHVEQDHRELTLEQAAQRVFARLGAHESLPERLEDRLEREQILGPIVDQQDVDLLGVGHRLSECRTLATGSEASVAAISAIDSDRASGTERSAAAGIVELSAVSGRCTSARPPRSKIRLSPRAPSAFAPVSTIPTDRSAYVSAAETNVTSIDGRL